MQTNWLFPGVCVRLASSDAEQVRRIRGLWQDLFPCKEILPEEIPIQLDGALTSWDLDSSPNGTFLPVGAQMVSELPSLRIFRLGSAFFLQSESALLRIQHSRVSGFVGPRFWAMPLSWRRELFFTAMLMLVRSQGLYGLHGSALQSLETQVLLVGDSGSGKTTASMALRRSGWSHVTDDVIVLRDRAKGVEALPFRRGISVTQFTKSRFSDMLARESGTWSALTEGKWLWTPDSPSGAEAIRGGEPRLLLFTEAASDGATRLIAINQTTAMTELIRQSAGIVVDGPSATTQLACLSRLARQATPYRLMTGPDLVDDASVLQRLVTEALGARVP